jgi:flagellar basal-body rod protein FlgF
LPAAHPLLNGGTAHFANWTAKDGEAMYYGLYISAAGANAQSSKVEVLSNNLANVNTVGFKRELSLLEAREAEAIERGLTARGTGQLEDIGGGVRLRATHTDFSPGTLQRTQIPSDLAIDSPDTFFQVQRGSQRLLTRAGNFHVSSEGVLVTPTGDPVLASDGTPVEIDPTLPFEFREGGIIEQLGTRIELALVRARNVSALQKTGDNYFLPTANAGLAAAEDRVVKSGYLEMSGVNPVDEMVELIAASRAYEANVRVIQQHDAATSELITRLLRA